MKTTLSLLLLAAFGLWAQPATSAAAAVPTPPGAGRPSADSAVPQPPRGAPSAVGATNASGTNAVVEMFPTGLIDFRAMDLNQFLDIYSDLVKRTILRPATLPAGTVTLTTREGLTMKEGIQAMETVMQLNGITVANIGDKFVEVLPSAQASTIPVIPSEHPPDKNISLGHYTVHYVQLKYVRPSEVVPLIQPMTATPNAIQPFDSTQMLALRDTEEHIARMMDMIEKVDVFIPVDYTNEVIYIKYAVAEDIASALNSLSGGGGSTTVGTRTSTGTSAGSSPARSLGTSPGRTGGSAGGTSFSSPAGISTAALGGAGGAMAGGGGTTAAGGAASGGSSFSQRLRNIISTGSGSGGAQGEIQVLGQTKILADPRSNALLVFATKQDMDTIKHIVEQLDIVLAQVMIEAAVVQVSLGSSSSFGVNWRQNTPISAGSGAFAGQGAVNAGPALSGSSFGSIANSASNAVNSALPGGISGLLSFGKKDDLDVTLTALASDNRAKILQMPRVQTSNAKAASLFVGESRPYPNGSYYGGGSYGGYSSIQQMPIGVSLEITPLINVEGLVVLDIHVRIDSVAGTVNIANVGDVPITSSKEAFSNVAVRNRDTIMLGGLIENDDSSSHSGVPLLKDIPVIGGLFRSSSGNKTRNELIVLIRPTVLETPEVAAQNAAAEQRNMPSVRRAQEEMRIDQERRTRQGEKEIERLRNDPK